MAPITTTTVIDRPATEVFEYATDPARFSQWQQGVVDGRLDHAGTPQVGDRCLTTRRIGGANRATTSRLTHINPPRTWGVRGTDGPIRATVHLTVEPLNETRPTHPPVDFYGPGSQGPRPAPVRRQASMKSGNSRCSSKNEAPHV